MKKTVRFFAKVFLAVSAVTAVLFTIYMTNADSKLIEFIYDKLLHYHETKKVEDHITEAFPGKRAEQESCKTMESAQRK